ncbi:hypothetical protein HYH02_000823 [Chlamydomonas schloesseri]|uniref:SART-1 protein n=1 Tax=Chlamydomonas schloesseri TaxID=2026947 RepID=A0A835WXJ3_9CHLO|nr:hypothetical protein HYH02_000823 [Chlamydomonas schloesseri]|eukprot:KAG2454998.1 hypothetical protein HYH02_000823 [Chlamydomonas schloesseri]
MEDNSGNEISLSIEETNKLRISLGLKPLRLDSGPSQADVERQNHEAKKQQEAAAQAQELRKKLEAAREKRLMDAKLKAVKTLGAADGDDGDGDMASWVEKNRRLEQQRREEAAAKAAAAAEKAAAARNKRKKRDDSDDEGGGGGYKADDLSGLKVRHDLGEVLEGETVIVTLADKPLLDDKGNLREGDSGDELENTLLAEEKRRRKAMKAAKKEAKPLWEEDGKVRTILDKYDEEEEEVVVAIGSGGMLEADRIRRQEEVRKKLAEGNAKLATFEGAAAAGTGTGAGGDYYTSAEMAAFSKPRKKKEKKERRIRAKSAEPEQEPEGDILATLEAQAEEAGGGAADLGRRADRGAALAAKEEAAKVAAEQKRARFEAAVQKANWASQFLRNAKGGMAGAAAAAGGAIGEEDEAADRELRESLERARRLAEKKKKEEEEEAARQAAEAAEAEAAGSGEDMEVEGEEKKDRKPAAPKSGIAALFADIAVKKEPEAAGGGGGGTVLTETMEFVRNITAAPSKAAAKAPNGAASPAPRDGAASAGGSAGGARGAYADGDGSDLDDDDGGGDARMRDSGGGTWMAAADGEGDGGEGGGGKGGREGSAGPAGGRGASRERSLPPDDVGITGERAVGRGLAGALGLLQNKGELKDGVEWSGRNTDRSKNALQGLEDVFTGGRQTDRVARSVEAALTVKDKYGRVLTPKERFRQLCHSFHGIKPSKNQVDKAAARDAKELAIKKAATSEDPSAELDRLRAVQRATGSAYVVLSGKNAGLPAAAAGGGGGGGGGDSDDEDMGRGRGGGGGGGGRMKPPAPRPPGGGKGGPPPGGPAFPLSGARGTVGNLTPLLGDRKVEAMLGIKKPGGKK